MAQPDNVRYYGDIDNRISDDQRNLLKDKTGFEGYTAYLEDCDKKHSGYGQLLETWRGLDEWWRMVAGNARICYYCDIIDLIKDDDSSISLNLCCHTASISELFTALSEPGKGVYGRIMIWRFPKYKSSDIKFLEDLGLVLKIGPNFLKSLFTRYSHQSQQFTHIPVFTASHVKVGDRLATMTRCCLSEKSNAVPIVFIADATDTRYDHPRVPKIVEPHLMAGYRISEYGEMIMGIIKRNSVFPKSADALILPALLAAIHMDSYNLRASVDCSRILSQRWGHGDPIETMNTDCNELRRRILDFEDVMQDAQEGFRSLYGADWSQKYECESTLEYLTETTNRARRFEAYVRDRCQADIGQLSLKESKKSIELSTSQLEEGKRVKIFTVLAFIYVPLGLASSIFGMNIQQLNNSGLSIWTFFVTAVVLLLLTGGLWLCIAEVNGYRAWSRRPRSIGALEPYIPGPTYNIAVRFRMLVWLYQQGYWTWARRTKAWRYILANRSPDIGPTKFRLEARALGEKSSGEEMSAGDYVSKYMDTKDAYDAFRIPDHLIEADALREMS